MDVKCLALLAGIKLVPEHLEWTIDSQLTGSRFAPGY